MPGNPRIALVDTGVNYTLPAFLPNVAVDKSGKLVGYDFWDDDPWPFDSDPRRTAFYPTHHGSTVFSVLVDEAPESTISLYRFPALEIGKAKFCLLYTSPSPRDRTRSRMPSSA